MILNESALKAMKFKEPIGQLVKDGDTAMACHRRDKGFYSAFTL